MSLPDPYYQDDAVTIYHGDCREILSSIPSVGMCITSPPYAHLRDGAYPSLGDDPESFALALADIFSDLRKSITETGYLWLNIGDTWAAGGNGGGGSLAARRNAWRDTRDRTGWRTPPKGFKKNDQTLLPFLCADAIRRRGWYLRQTVIWSKPAATEPIRRDRPPLSHEYIFCFRACERAERVGTIERGTVWNICPDRSTNHPATMPIELVSRCLSYSEGDVVDPFMGSGTTLRAAKDLGRKAIGIEIEEKYCEIAAKRMQQEVLDFQGLVSTTPTEQEGE